jgi:hypothetical protein
MTLAGSTHLSEEALHDALIGLESPDSELHLLQCEACRNQLHAFQSGMRAFNEASLSWSEARQRRPLPILAARNAAWFAGQLKWAMAVLVAVAIGLPAWLHEREVIVRNIPHTVETAEDTEAQIAQDNDLLKSINAALSEDDVSPMKEYHLSDQPQPRRRARTGSRNR